MKAVILLEKEEEMLFGETGVAVSFFMTRGNKKIVCRVTVMKLVK